MDKRIETPSSGELLKELLLIVEINERIENIDLIRLKELIIELNKLIFERFETINNFLVLNPNYTLEWAQNHISQYGLNYNNLIELKGFIETRINYLSIKQTNTFNDLVFKDAPSEMFFEFLVENWLVNDLHKTTTLRFIFNQMWYLNTENDAPFKIKSTQTYFASEYWNKKYSNILELNPVNSKLNQKVFTDYYYERFKNYLKEFQGG